jgi:hypothetical protein
MGRRLVSFWDSHDIPICHKCTADRVLGRIWIPMRTKSGPQRARRLTHSLAERNQRGAPQQAHALNARFARKAMTNVPGNQT